MKNTIKLSLFASVLAFSAFSAQAAQIYSKDGTTLGINGYIDTVYWSGHNNLVSDKGDQTIGYRVRFGLDGRTRLTDGIDGFARYQTQYQENGSSTEAVPTQLRDAYVGIDFGKYGTLKAGRYLDNLYKIEGITDIFERLSGFGEQFANRNSGKINYEINFKGFSAALEYQTAVDNYSFIDYKANVDRGYSLVLGYTSPDVLFGPVSIHAAYGYFDFQDTDAANLNNFKYDSKLEKYTQNADDSDNYGVSLTWGNLGSGLYLASWFEESKVSYNSDIDDYKIKSSETAVSYAFSNGITLQAGYDWKRYVDTSTTKRKGVLFLSYNPNASFRVWTDVAFDAGSSDDISDDTLYSVGARFVF